MRKKAPRKGNVIASPSQSKARSGQRSALKSPGVSQAMRDEWRAESVAHFKDHAPGVPLPKMKKPKTAEEWAREWNKAGGASRNSIARTPPEGGGKAPKRTGGRSNRIGHQFFPAKNRRDAVFSDEEIIALKEYLAGDTDKGEVKAAAYYEYARRNKHMLAVAEQLRAMPKKRKAINADPLGRFTEELDSVPVWIERDPWPAILACECFPEKSWTALSQDQKKPIVEALKFSPQLPELRQKAALRMIANHKPGKNDPIRYVTFGLDYTKGEAGLRDEFAQWLKLKKNQDLIERFTPKTSRGKKVKGRAQGGSRFLKALQDLATVMVRERHRDFQAAMDYSLSLHKSDEKGNPKRFWQLQKCGKDYTPPLYESPQQMNEAEDRVKGFASGLFPDW